jgi:hypothetical protein
MTGVPRIRTIKPEFPHDETLGRVSRDARFLFVLLWTCCDDHGRFRASPAYLRGQLYPFDEDVSPALVETWLNELEQIGRVKSYRINAETYAAVTNWARHQRVDNASRRVCPAPPWEAETPGDTPQVAAVNGKSRSEVKGKEDDALSPSPTPAASLGGSPLDREGEGDRDRDHSSSSEVTARGAADGAADAAEEDEESLNERVGQALSVLARRDLDAAVARGTTVANRAGWLRVAISNRSTTDRQRLIELNAANPGWTAARLAEAITNPPTDRPAEHETEGTGRGVPMPEQLKQRKRT